MGIVTARARALISPHTLRNKKIKLNRFDHITKARIEKSSRRNIGEYRNNC